MSKEYRTERLDVREQRLTNEICAVSTRIYEARKALEMTQSAVADFAGVSVSTIKRYEHGEGEMSIQNLFYIASALNLDLSELMSDRKYLLYKYSLFSVGMGRY